MQEADLVALARAFIKHRGETITVQPGAESVAGTLPHVPAENGARFQVPTFEEWLVREDAAALTV
jgi:hypothetical protein